MKKVLLLLANGFETYEASVFIDVFGWNLTEGNKNTQVITCGLTKVVKSSFGVTILADQVIDEIDSDAFDAVAVPGGFEKYHFYDDAYKPVFLDLIRAFYDKKKVIASICVGALPVGKSGILIGKKATTYQGLRQSQLKEFGALVVDEPIVFENRIITSRNPSTAIKVAFLLLESLTTKNNSDKVKTLMGF